MSGKQVKLACLMGILKIFFQICSGCFKGYANPVQDCLGSVMPICRPTVSEKAVLFILPPLSVCSSLWLHVTVTGVICLKFLISCSCQDRAAQTNTPVSVAPQQMTLQIKKDFCTSALG